MFGSAPRASETNAALMRSSTRPPCRARGGRRQLLDGPHGRAHVARGDAQLDGVDLLLVEHRAGQEPWFVEAHLEHAVTRALPDDAVAGDPGGRPGLGPYPHRPVRK